MLGIPRVLSVSFQTTSREPGHGQPEPWDPVLTSKREGWERGQKCLPGSSCPAEATAREAAAETLSHLQPRTVCKSAALVLSQGSARLHS